MLTGPLLYVMVLSTLVAVYHALAEVSWRCCWRVGAAWLLGCWAGWPGFRLQLRPQLWITAAASSVQGRHGAGGGGEGGLKLWVGELQQDLGAPWPAAGPN